MKKSMKILSVIALSAVLLSACGGPEDRAAAYVDKGRDLLESRNYLKARLEIRNALQIQEDNIGAWLLLAHVQERLKDYESAFGSYNKILGLDENQTDALVGRGRIYLAARQLDNAKKDAEKAVALAPQHSDVVLLQAGIAAAEKRADEALPLARQALEADADNHRARVFLALLLVGDKRFEDAESLLDAGIELEPRETDLWQAKAVVHGASGDGEKQVEVLRKLTELQPDDVKPLHLLVASLRRQKRIEEAETLLRDRLAGHPNEAETGVLLANLLIGSKEDRTQQDRAFSDLIGEYTEINELRSLRVKWLLGYKDIDGAKAELNSMIRDLGTEGAGLSARKQLAGLLLAEGDREGGAALIAEVLKENPRDGDALIGRAAMSLTAKDIGAAIADLRVVLADRPASQQANDLIVRAYLAKGEAEQAADQLARYIENAPQERDPYIALSELYAKLDRQDESERVLARLLSAQPKDVFALRRLSELALLRNDLVDALQRAEQLRDIYPEKPEGYYAVGVVYSASGAHDEAAEMFIRALEIQPDAIEPLTSLVRTRIVQDRIDLAKRELEQRIAADANHFVAQNLLGELLRREGRLEDSLSYFARASEINKGWVIPYINSVDVLKSQNKEQEALALLERSKKATGGSSIIALQLAAMREQLGDRLGAIREYEELLASTPDAMDAANNLAVLLTQGDAEDMKLDRAYQLAKRFERSRNPLYRNTLGWVLFLRGDLDASIPHLEYAANNESKLGELQYHLGAAYAKVGRTTDAKARIERALALNQSFYGVENAREILRAL